MGVLQKTKQEGCILLSVIDELASKYFFNTPLKFVGTMGPKAQSNDSFNIHYIIGVMYQS